MKKNRTMRVAVLMLALTLVTCCFVGSTFAKYTSTATGTDLGTVAKWSFTVEDANIATANTFTMDLFALPDANVKQTNGLIAPGTSGNIEINLANTSEVNAEYTIDFTCTKSTAAATLPIQFKIGTDGQWKNDINELDITEAQAIAMESGTGSVTLYWQWVFNGDDSVDTALGVAAADGETVTCEVSAKVTASQVD